MKIVGPTNTLPQASSAGTAVRGRAANASKVGIDPPLVAAEARQWSSRPVRISRFPEEAALFAYTRQASLDLDKAKAQIDEYV